MTANVENEPSGHRDPATPRDYMSLSREIWELAREGTPRIKFLRDISRMLVAVSGCDCARLVLRHSQRQYRCQYSARPVETFDSDVASLDDDPASPVTWSSGRNEALERICLDIVGKTFNASLPWFSDNGTFFIGRTKRKVNLDVKPSATTDPLGIAFDRRHRSLAVIPVEAGHDRFGLLQVGSCAENYLDENTITELERVAQSIGIAWTHRRSQVALRERVKELTCLYGIARLVGDPDLSLEDVLAQSVELLPPGWLYPDIAVARIVLEDKVFATPGFEHAVQTQKAHIESEGWRQGFVEVGYTVVRPQLDEGPFLTEERNLLDAIARELAAVIEEKRAELEQANLREQLLHADRLVTIGQLGAGVAHELNEPLANILGFAQLAAKTPGMPEQSREDMGKIVNAALHAREVIKKLLLFAREAKSDHSRVNLNEVVEDGLYFLGTRLNYASIEIDKRLDKNLPDIMADRSGVLQVFTNILVNAIQAMPDGGTLIIATDGRDGSVFLTIADTGIGMTREVQRKIFNPFYTTKDIDEGTGLGLSVVHGIITALGGSVQVESAPGEGSRFVVRFPGYGDTNETEVAGGD